MQIAYPRCICIHTRASTRNSSIYVFKSPRSSSGTFVGFSNRTVYSCISICTYRFGVAYVILRDPSKSVCAYTHIHTHEHLYRLSLSRFRIPLLNATLRFTLAIIRRIKTAKHKRRKILANRDIEISSPRNVYN